MPTCLPAIVPGSGFDEDAWTSDGREGVEEVGGGGEEFVRLVEDAGGEGRGDEVWRV